MGRTPRAIAAVLLLTATGLLAACAPATSSPGGQITVVAAENVWGSIARQLGGAHVTVTSIVSDPNADPHDYQTSTRNARAFATARYVIVNGAGYDTWAASLLAANPSPGRTVLNVADLVGKRDGDNPHFWYSPSYVEAVADRITKDLTAIDQADSTAFTRQRTSFETELQPLHDRIDAITSQFAGRKIAATESIFVYMSDALRLNLISPPDLMKAIAEGNDPAAGAIATFEQQLQSKEATLLVYNRQTATDVTSTLKELATHEGIAIVGVTETIQPPDSSFQDWMTAQLTDLQNGLNAAAPAK